MTTRKIAGLTLAVMTILFVLYCVIFLNHTQQVKIEKGVAKALEAYAGSLGDGTDVQVLNKELSTLIEEKIAEWNRGELTTEELEELSLLVEEELSVRMEDISREELGGMTEQIMKTILESGVGDDSEAIRSYKEEMKQLAQEQYLVQEQQITNLTNSITELKNNTEKLNAGFREEDAALGERTTTLESRATGLDERTSALETHTGELETRTRIIEDNGLFYSYDEDSRTLYLFGKDGLAAE